MPDFLVSLSSAFVRCSVGVIYSLLRIVTEQIFRLIMDFTYVQPSVSQFVAQTINRKCLCRVVNRVLNCIAVSADRRNTSCSLPIGLVVSPRYAHAELFVFVRIVLKLPITLGLFHSLVSFNSI